MPTIASTSPAFAGRNRPIALHRAAVELLYRYGLEVEALKAAHVDRRHGLARRVVGLPVGMDAAVRAKTVLDDVLIEQVGGRVIFGRAQAQLFARHEPEERALAGANRAIALQ